MSLRWALIDRVLGRFDPATQAKLHWRALVRDGDPHAQAMRELVRPGDTAIDVGANWGLFTIGLSGLVGAEGRVIAAEPGPALATLRRVCRGRANIELCALALSDHDGSGRMTVPAGRGSETGLSALAHVVDTDVDGDQDGAMSVRLARLDGLELGDLSRLNFIKCDVEGHEDAVLRGGEALIREHLPALLLEAEQRHRDRPVAELFELLGSWGYAGYALTSAGLGPLEQFEVERDQSAHLVDGDLPFPTPPGYINDFLFLREGAPSPRLLGGRQRS